jgi:hypothetical protein
MKLKFMTGIQIAFFSVLIAATAHAVLADGNPANHAKFKAAVATCSEQLNLTTPIDWKSLDQKTKEDMHSCMQAQGVTFHHHHWKAIQACMTAAGQTLPPFTPGQPRPTLTDAQKAALQTCKQQVRAAHAAENSNPAN